MVYSIINKEVIHLSRKNQKYIAWLDLFEIDYMNYLDKKEANAEHWKQDYFGISQPPTPTVF